MRFRIKWLVSGFMALAFTLAGSTLSVAGAQAGALSPGTYNNDNAAIAYTAGWVVTLDAGAFHGDHIRTVIYGRQAAFTFSGNQLVLIHTRTPDSGVFQVRIDDATYEFDAYSATTQFQAQWASPRLSGNSHSVVIQKKYDDGKPVYLDSLKIRNVIVVPAGKSIQSKCMDEAIAGSLCIVKSGTFRERITVDKKVTFTCKGTCVVTGGFDVRANRAVLRGFELTSRGIMVKGKYIIIEGNFVHDLASETGILFYDGLKTDHVQVRNNVIVRANNACILIAGTNHLVEGNDCSATKQPPTYDGDADCFRYFGGNHVFRNNTCHDIWYGNPGYNTSVGDYVDNAHIDCFQTWNWESRGGVGHDLLFEGNYCDLPDQNDQEQAKGLQTEGITSDGAIDITQDYPCHGLVFKNNVIHSNLLGIFKYCQDITVLNNTFVGDASTYAGGLHLLSLKGTNTIRYNIFVDQDDGAFVSYSAETRATVVSGYNLIYRSDGVPGGSPQPGDMWDINPLFVDRAGGDYHLQPGSPACGWGALPCD